jgi:hypothetical protein
VTVNPMVDPDATEARRAAANKVARRLQDACDCKDPNCELRQAATLMRALALANYELERALHELLGTKGSAGGR